MATSIHALCYCVLRYLLIYIVDTNSYLPTYIQVPRRRGRSFGLWELLRDPLQDSLRAYDCQRFRDTIMFISK